MSCYKEIYEKEYQEGKAREQSSLEILQEKLNLPNLQSSKNRYSRFDFFDDISNTLVEYRSRNCLSTDYETTMIPKCKFDYAKSVRQDCKIVIQFKDKMLLLNVDKRREYKAEYGGRNNRMKNEFRKKYVYIPLNELIEI